MFGWYPTFFMVSNSSLKRFLSTTGVPSEIWRKCIELMPITSQRNAIKAIVILTLKIFALTIEIILTFQCLHSNSTPFIFVSDFPKLHLTKVSFSKSFSWQAKVFPRNVPFCWRHFFICLTVQIHILIHVLAWIKYFILYLYSFSICKKETKKLIGSFVVA